MTKTTHIKKLSVVKTENRRCDSDSHLANNPSCPAIGKLCSKCGLKDHFRACCRIKKESLNAVNYQRDNKLIAVAFGCGERAAQDGREGRNRVSTVLFKIHP